MVPSEAPLCGPAARRADAMAAATAAPRAFVGADCFGAAAARAAAAALESAGFAVTWLAKPRDGTSDPAALPYYEAAEKVASRVACDSGINPCDAEGLPRRVGVLACGTGAGVCMVANKHPGVRAAVCLGADDAADARSINDANVLCLAGLRSTPGAAAAAARAFAATRFGAPCAASGGEAWGEAESAFLRESGPALAAAGSRLAASAQQVP